MEDRDLTREDARALEQVLVSKPEDVGARSKLLRYYFLSDRSHEDRKRHREHVLWMVRHRPEAEIAGTPFAPPAAEPDDPRWPERWDITTAGA